MTNAETRVILTSAIVDVALSHRTKQEVLSQSLENGLSLLGVTPEDPEALRSAITSYGMAMVIHEIEEGKRRVKDEDVDSKPAEAGSDAGASKP